MLLLRSLSTQRLLLIAAALFCISAGMLAQTEKPDTCKIVEQEKPVVEKKQDVKKAKAEVKRKNSADTKVKATRKANLEHAFLFKNHIISKL
ncbi:hypothetical protein KEM09_00775 [Carboxylicivirga mesophila]|uniref:Uncharacterized protein n=1 Tax=Carboxylicivirga mesophila TaxID=1166478 RepID=A0ABS5K5W3_9BACT|nr:hypothetical protein [Carboxylicivirga mesophila]MBS2209918.1 hypothetical protein [Carboxylicivirga mesophila]